MQKPKVPNFRERKQNSLLFSRNSFFKHVFEFHPSSKPIGVQIRAPRSPSPPGRTRSPQGCQSVGKNEPNVLENEPKPSFNSDPPSHEPSPASLGAGGRDIDAQKQPPLSRQEIGAELHQSRRPREESESGGFETFSKCHRVCVHAEDSGAVWQP